MSYKTLLSPMNIGNLTIKNRTVMTAAEMGMNQPDGTPSERLMSYYEERAKGGVGLIIPGICRVNDIDAPSSFTQLSMSQDWHIGPMRTFADRIHAHGAKLGIQLHHAGRQGYASVLNVLPLMIPVTASFPSIWNLVYKMVPTLLKLEEKGVCFPVMAPSVAERSYHVPSRMLAMSNRKVKSVINDYIEAAVRCQKAGVDIVELHAAHGYLIQQFLSPNTNFRTDEYGGSFENRMRFLTEIIDGIRKRCGKEYPLMVRLTVDEMYDRIGKPGKGYTLEEGKKIAKRLEELGVDALNITSACYDTYNYWLETTSFEPGWRAYLAKEIKQIVKIPVVAANYMRSPEQAEKQLNEGVQDFIGTARTFICDPYWVNKVAEDRVSEIRRCIGCVYCMESLTNNAGYNLSAGLTGECALNYEVGKEYLKKPNVDGNGRNVVVVGAGPSGLTAAEVLAKRGFKVTVLEKAKRAGGQVITGATCSLKEKLYWCIEDLLTSVKKLGVKVKLGTEATKKKILALNPYAVIIASGGTPVVPKSIVGIDLPNVFTAPDIIMKRQVLENKNVVVVGSGITGLETVELLNENGNSVTVVEMADEIAPGTWFQLTDDEMSRIKPYGTKFLLGKRLSRIEAGHVVVQDTKTGRLTIVKADNVVLSMGVKPENALFYELREEGTKVYSVGDAKEGGTIAKAVHSAYKIAADLE